MEGGAERLSGKLLSKLLVIMKEIKRVAIVGSHGLYANYGGWDQLVRNLAEKKATYIEYLIFNSADSPRNIKAPQGVTVKHLKYKASGFQGLFFDFWSILSCFRHVDTILLLGVQGIILIPFLNIFKKIRIVSNPGGIEWERPKFNLFTKLYLKLCFKLSFKYSNYVIIDNPYYYNFLPKRKNAKVIVVPYGGEIDTSLTTNAEIEQKYSFIKSEYLLSISRAMEDNLITELCESFVGSKHILVVISNLSSSTYGLVILKKYNNCSNIILINGLYNKPELDLVRRKCKAYIHTHTLCGTAPSLVEMIVCQRPIFSIDNPQNRFTMHDEGFLYSTFSEIQDFLNSDSELTELIPSAEICKFYDWNKIVTEYQSLF